MSEGKHMDNTEEIDVAGIKVAVIDDAKTIRMMMSHTLKGMGCEVECAEDGYKALGLLRRFKPPDFSGYHNAGTRRLSNLHVDTQLRRHAQYTARRRG